MKNFIALRDELISEGLFEVNPTYYIYKSIEAFSLLLFAFILQYFKWYFGFFFSPNILIKKYMIFDFLLKNYLSEISRLWRLDEKKKNVENPFRYLTSAIILALCWQQFGWLTHDFCHQQPSKNRCNNDFISLIFGNIIQGFSRDWWKEKHNTHHAATNIIGQVSENFIIFWNYKIFFFISCNIICLFKKKQMQDFVFFFFLFLSGWWYRLSSFVSICSRWFEKVQNFVRTNHHKG